MSSNTKGLLPRTLSFPSGIVTVQDAYDETKWYTLFPGKEKSWTEYLEKPWAAGAFKK